MNVLAHFANWKLAYDRWFAERYMEVSCSVWSAWEGGSNVFGRVRAVVDSVVIELNERMVTWIGDGKRHRRQRGSGKRRKDVSTRGGLTGIVYYMDGSRPRSVQSRAHMSPSSGTSSSARKRRAVVKSKVAKANAELDREREKRKVERAKEKERYTRGMQREKLSALELQLSKIQAEMKKFADDEVPEKPADIENVALAADDLPDGAEPQSLSKTNPEETPDRQVRFRTARDVVIANETTTQASSSSVESPLRAQPLSREPSQTSGLFPSVTQSDLRKQPPR